MIDPRPDPVVERRDAASGRREAPHDLGKLTARERIEFLVDEGSFEELDGASGDGVITGRGTISGRTIFVFARDVAAAGAALSQDHAQKIAKLQDMALRDRAPIIGLFDGEGAPGGGTQMIERSVLASGVVPQIAVIMGPCVGADALAAALSDVVFMVRGTSHLFVAGPDVVKAVFNATVTPQDLGGTDIHTATSAIADHAYDNDVEALLQVRRLVDVLPISNEAPLPDWPAPSADADDASLDLLVLRTPHAPYDVKELIAKVADDGDVFELQDAHAKNVVIALGRVEGRPVGFVANQPKELAGVLDGDAARKAARFVRFCDCFSIPIVTFVEVPGFLPGIDQEQGGLAKHGAKLLYAYAEASVPKVTVVTGKAFGAAFVVMGSKYVRADLTFGWPTAQLAARGGIDAVIAPRETRRKVARGLAMLSDKAQQNPWKKHGNIPL